LKRKPKKKKRGSSSSSGSDTSDINKSKWYFYIFKLDAKRNYNMKTSSWRHSCVY
jgi:hypothetical protein